jgi:hypothetical protein
MDENTIIEQLEELIKTFGVQIRREPIKQDEDLVKVVGGLCLLRWSGDTSATTVTTRRFSTLLL